MSSIESQFKEVVWKQGYTLEQSIYELLDQKGWGLLPNRLYYDSSSNTAREYDLLAIKRSSYRRHDLFTVIVVECKHNPGRIVFYSRRTDPEQHLPQMLIGDFTKNLISEKDIKDVFSKMKHYRKYFTSEEQVFGYQFFSEKTNQPAHSPKGKGASITIEFQPNSTQSRDIVFSAIRTAIQATRYEHKTRNPSLYTGDLVLFFPVIVFSGNLFRASLAKKKTLSAQNYFQYHTGMTTQENQAPDDFDLYIASKEAFTDLEKAISSVHEKFKSTMKEALDKK